ncbi:unnamed protein product, partial [Protopolystoma xenopodis]
MGKGDTDLSDPFCGPSENGLPSGRQRVPFALTGRSQSKSSALGSTEPENPSSPLHQSFSSLLGLSPTPSQLGPQLPLVSGASTRAPLAHQHRLPSQFGTADHGQSACRLPHSPSQPVELDSAAARIAAAAAVSAVLGSTPGLMLLNGMFFTPASLGHSSHPQTGLAGLAGLAGFSGPPGRPPLVSPQPYFYCPTGPVGQNAPSFAYSAAMATAAAAVPSVGRDSIPRLGLASAGIASSMTTLGSASGAGGGGGHGGPVGNGAACGAASSEEGGSLTYGLLGPRYPQGSLSLCCSNGK